MEMNHLHSKPFADRSSSSRPLTVSSASSICGSGSSVKSLRGLNRCTTAYGKMGQRTADSPPIYSSYIDRDAALKRLNEELEQKSQEIFKKIEQYSNKCKNNSYSHHGGGGDAPPAPAEIFSMKLQEAKIEDNYAPRMLTAKEKVEDSLEGFEFLDFKGSDSSLDSSKNTEESVITSSSMGGHSSKGSGSTIIASSPETKDVDMKARKRLQKATESVVKCLQSKLISHESRLADLHIQFRQKIQENTMLEGKIRALEDDRERLVKSLNNLQSAVEKSSKTADVTKSNLAAKNQAFAALKKDVDALKRDQKEKTNSAQNLQTRLNRCVEENDRLKNQNRSLQVNMRDRQYDDRSVIDELQQKVCQLEQQKSILNATISKQTGLIRTLRNHKIQMTSSCNSNVKNFVQNDSENI